MPDEIIISRFNMPMCDECHKCGKMLLYHRGLWLWAMFKCPWCDEVITLGDCVMSRTGPVDKTQTGKWIEKYVDGNKARLDIE